MMVQSSLLSITDASHHNGAILPLAIHRLWLVKYRLQLIIFNYQDVF